jgi:hypothetical protein
MFVRFFHQRNALAGDCPVCASAPALPVRFASSVFTGRGGGKGVSRVFGAPLKINNV